MRTMEFQYLQNQLRPFKTRYARLNAGRIWPSYDATNAFRAPCIYYFISYTSGAIAIYFVTSNIVMLLQLVLAHVTKRTIVLDTK